MAPKTPRHCRLVLLCTALSVLVLAGSLEADEGVGGFNEDLTRINSDFLVSTVEVQQWHAEKDKMGPTFSGSPGWHAFLRMLETKLSELGAVGIVKNSWTYDRWYTTEWPDDTHWSLVSDGMRVKVASYGAYSGSTGPEGVRAPLLYYDPSSPPRDLEGKIVVFPVTPVDSISIQSDYEFATDEETLDAPGARIEDFDATHFQRQVATMAQLTGELMVAAPGSLSPTTGAARQTRLPGS